MEMVQLTWEEFGDQPIVQGVSISKIGIYPSKAAGTDNTLTVAGNITWTAAVTEGADWLSLRDESDMNVSILNGTAGETMLTVAYTRNDSGSTRQGKTTITATPDEGDPIAEVFNVLQSSTP